MKTVEIEIYQFNELSPKSKIKALEKFSDINVDHGWYESVYDWFIGRAAEAGFSVDRIYFSGFYSQGDGAMFEYSDPGDDKLLREFIDTLDLSPMRKSWLLSQVYCRYSGTHSGHYYHSGCCSHSITFESNFTWSAAENFSDWIDSFHSDFEEFIESKYRDLCDELYDSLQIDYEYLTSEEAIIETIEANNYEFFRDGSIY
jgi:hypothetical protein